MQHSVYGLLRVVQVINVERPGISAYVSCARDGTIKFWHKATFAPYRTIRHLDAMKAACEVLIMASDALLHSIFLCFSGSSIKVSQLESDGSACKYGNSTIDYENSEIYILALVFALLAPKMALPVL